MKKYLDWIIAHKVKTGLIVFGLFIVPLVVIHLLYKWITPNYMLQSSWSSGELITYIAGFEAFIGTVFLGAIAVYQNEQANELNIRMIKREEKRDRFARQPLVMIHNWQVNYIEYQDLESDGFSARIYEGIFEDLDFAFDKSKFKFLLITLNLVNASKTNIEFKIDGLDINGLRPNQFSVHYGGGSLNPKYDFYHLCSNATAPFSFLLEDEVNLLSIYKECVLEISMSNTVGEKTKEKIEFHIFGVRPDFIGVYPDNYTILPPLDENSHS